jgi:hypothetical protein
MSTNSFLFVRFISQLVIYTQDDSIFLIRYFESLVLVPVLSHIDDVSSCQRVIYTHDESTSGVVDKIFIEILIRYRFYQKNILAWSHPFRITVVISDSVRGVK